MAKFTFDPSKRKKNLEKHRLDLANAAEAFNDDYGFFAPDPRYDADDRWILIAHLHEQLITLAYVERQPEHYHSISMRPATPAEKEKYEQERLQQTPTSNDPMIKLLKLTEEEREYRKEMKALMEEYK